MSHSNLASLTKQYIEAFDSKDLRRVSELLNDEFALEDPIVKRVEGKSNALKKIDEIFKGCKELSFHAKNIFVDGNTSVIEFRLSLDDTVLKGVDIIEWNYEKISELRAYLDVPK